MFFGTSQDDTASIDLRNIETMQDLIGQVGEILYAYRQIAKKSEEDQDT